jgi:restriction endonuclease S subunit
MTATTLAQSRAFAVWWKDLNRWDYGFFRSLAWAWPKEMLIPVGALLNRKIVEVSPTEDKTTLPIIEKISFGGQISVTDAASRKNYKGRLFWAARGDLIYSKIRVKQGSLAIVPIECERLAVSAEYPVYNIDHDRVDPTFLVLVLKSKSFLSIFEGLSHGGSTKTRIPPIEFERQKIPLPALAEQGAIVASWRKAQSDIAAAKQRIEKIQSCLHQDTHRLLGMAVSNNYILPKAFAIEWRSLERWSVEFLGRQLLGLNAKEAGVYPSFPLGVLCNGISGGTPSKRRSDFWNGNIPWISPKDMKSDQIYNSQDHITQKAVDEGASLVPKNSVLLVVRSGILQHTVPVAVNKVDTAINQDIRAFVPKNGHKILSDYLADFLSAQQGALLRLVKWSTTVQSINKEELDSFPVPLPPLPIQREIVAVVAASRKEIARERTVAETLARDIDAEVEALILGTKKVKEAHA